MRLVKLSDLTLLVKDGGIFLLISKNWESNQRSGRILEVQSQNVGACTFKFSFSRITGGIQINIFFCKNCHEASFWG